MKWSIPERTIDKGRDYVNQERVLSVTADPEKNVWHAEVLGSELYRVELDATPKEEDYCQCPYWEEHHYCKHTVAVELYLRKQGKSRKITKNSLPKQTKVSPSKLFSQGFQYIQEEHDRKVQPLRIQCQLESLATNPYRYELDVLGITLKIGKKDARTYVVKNIYKFLQQYREEGTFSTNSQNNFFLTTEAFTTEENELFTHFSQLAQNQELMGYMGIQVNGKMDKRYLMLPVDSGKKLIEKMLPYDFSFQGKHSQLNDLVFSDQKQPLAFQVTKKDDKFELQVKKDFDQVFKHYGWGLIDSTLYYLSAQAFDSYMIMEQLLKRLKTNAIFYPKDELSVLFKQVLPKLRQIGEVQIDQEIYNFISQEPLSIVFYLRKQRGMIDLRADLLYGQTVFSTDPKHQKVEKDHPEILRDYKKEKRMEDLIDTLHFEKTAKGWQKPLPQGQALYHFFTRELAYLRQFGKIRMGKKLRELYLDKEQEPKIQVDRSDSWLDVTFDISGINQSEIDDVLQSLLNNDAFYTLKNGQVLSLESEEFQETSQILSSLRKNMTLKEGTAQVPLYQGLQLQNELADQAQFTDDFKQMTTDLIHPEQFDVALPKNLQANLRNYQVVGFRWLKMLGHYQFGGILADEMGLGKTLQMISYLLSEKNEHHNLQALIVAPASLTYNWHQEIKRFAPSLKSVVVSGNRDQRDQLLQEKTDIWITSYASLRQDVDLYKELPLNYLVLDEAQMVKNSSTKTAHALRSLKIDRRFALSGTPIENNLEELWSLFQMIMPGFFPTKQEFREISTERIARMIQPFVLRRDKRTVLQDLPEKLETNYYSALTDEQKKVYLAYLGQMREEVSGMSSESFQKNRINILAGLTRLRQICCHPALFIDNYKDGSGKLEQVKDLIQAAKENGRRVLLFSQFTSMLSIIEEELNDLGLKTYYLRGSTPPKDRLQMVEDFNQGQRDVFLISLKAGGTGLNLTGADTVILYDLWWNPAVEEQAAGRAHRIGQKHVVEVWRMIAEGTIEERMDSLQQEKKELFQKVIQGNDTQLQKMTEEDIRMILSIGEDS
ncbi:MAG TPA: DEAD/DEAH box helicase [Candidatus Tetragenococcus pullicola]|nr:DEAD/DEAH box helicase [Candidatus Tetragenococcus pullicola]